MLRPGLVAEFAAAGIDRQNILILVATGLHRLSKGQELREVVGSDEVFESVPIADHFARDREAHVDLGRTPSGVPTLIDRRFVEADLRIVVGLVEPHFMAGYSGGRKLVAPGVAHQDTGASRLQAAEARRRPPAAACPRVPGASAPRRLPARRCTSCGRVYRTRW